MLFSKNLCEYLLVYSHHVCYWEYVCFHLLSPLSYSLNRDPEIWFWAISWMMLPSYVLDSSQYPTSQYVCSESPLA